MTEKPPKGIDMLWGLRIPMRDGVHLHATVFRPKGDTRTPVILLLTPYHADTYQRRAWYFAHHGYAFALVDHRGRGNSEGEFVPFENVGLDGYDAVEWLARQPWCDGQVAMWGGSYAGLDQWLTLKESPPHLASIAPVAEPIVGYDFPYLGGIGMPYWLQWMTLTSGKTTNWNLYDQEDFWIEKYQELYRGEAPFSDFERIVGNPTTMFQTWARTPPHSAYWKQFSLTPDDYRRVRIPILSIAGYYDLGQLGQLLTYRGLKKYGSPEVHARHFVLIGPWDHEGTRTPVLDVGGVHLNKASALDLDRLHKEWYDWTMKGGPRPEMLQKRVAYYVSGAERWRFADDLDAIHDTTKRLYLDSVGGRANSVLQSGRLSEQASSSSQPDHYTYDPLDLRAADLERPLIISPKASGLTDQSIALSLPGNGLVYHSEPFERDTEVTGQMRLTAWIAADVPDTDFEITLAEIRIDGSQVWLTGAQLRARYREGFASEKLLTPNQIVRYEFDGLNIFSRQIARGSRIRLLLRCQDSIEWQKNHNSGGVVSDETKAQARTAHITVFHDAEHPSCLELPVVTGS